MHTKLFIAYVLLFFVILIPQSALSLKLDRVILATNDNPYYIHFWPLAAKTWQKIVGIRPTLALIGSENVQVDTTLGDVIRFEPIDGIPTSFYAQCVRLLLPCLFPDEGCILADIDLLPLQKDFFTQTIAHIPNDCFIIYRDKAYWFFKPRVYLPYNAAKGSVFREIFGIQTIEEIPSLIQQWYTYGIGWSTDERMIYTYLKKWDKRKTHVKKLGYTKGGKKRIDRKKAISFSAKKLLKQYYEELNCPRPYYVHANQIDQIVKFALIAAERKK